MGADEPLYLHDDERLAALRELDQHRPWQSLDDRRRCLECGRLITGRQITIVVYADGSGPRRGICPTQGCASIPMDWALPRDDYVIIPGAEEEAIQAPATMWNAARN